MKDVMDPIGIIFHSEIQGKIRRLALSPSFLLIVGHLYFKINFLYIFFDTLI